MVTGLEIFAGILVFLGLYVGLLLPAYVVAVRSGVDSPWLAWVPLVGASIALLRVIGQSGWWALLVLVPYVGALVLDIWLAVEIPRRHARSGWWTPGFIFLPLISWYWYAFTLPREPASVVAATAY